MTFPNPIQLISLLLTSVWLFAAGARTATAQNSGVATSAAVKAMTTAYEDQLAKLAVDHEAQLTKLRGAYLEALVRFEEKYKAGGDLLAMLAVMEERKRFDESIELPGSLPRKHRKPGDLLKARKAYRDTVKKIEGSQRKELADARKAQVGRLTKLRADLESAGKARESLQAKWALDRLLGHADIAAIRGEDTAPGAGRWIKWKEDEPDAFAEMWGGTFLFIHESAGLGQFNLTPRKGRFQDTVAYEPIGESRIDAQKVIHLDSGAYRLKGSEFDIFHGIKQRTRFTLEVVAKIGELPESESCLLTCPAGDGTANLSILQEKNRFYLRLRTSAKIAGKEGNQDLTAGRARAGEWVHLVMAFRPGNVTAWCNGKQALTSTRVKGDLSNWQPAPIVLGNDVTGDKPWPGSIETLAVAGRAVTEKEMQYLFKRFTIKHGVIKNGK